ncbi:MAG: NAD-dependent epimerase/dehydratase family protein, partial [Chitinophagaceae bacterium]
MKGIVLITGANGFIGSFIIEEALKHSYKVLAAVRNTAKKLAIENAAIEKVTLSFGNKELMTNQLKAIIEKYGRIDYVIHNAGITQANKTAEFYQINAQASFDFAKALAEAIIPLKK